MIIRNNIAFLAVILSVIVPRTSLANDPALFFGSWKIVNYHSALITAINESEIKKHAQQSVFFSRWSAVLFGDSCVDPTYDLKKVSRQEHFFGAKINEQIFNLPDSILVIGLSCSGEVHYASKKSPDFRKEIIVQNDSTLILFLHGVYFSARKIRVCDPGKENLEKLQTLNKKLKSVKKSDSLLSYFQYAARLREDINKFIRRVPEFTDGNCGKNIADRFPFLSFSFVAEGTEPHYYINYKWFLERSRKTSGTVDDSLFSLLNDIWDGSGEPGLRNPVWIVGTTCLSGYSLLGDGTYMKFIRRITSLSNQKSGIVDAELKKLYELLIDDLSGRNYGHSYEKALSELNAILDLDAVKEEDKTRLKELVRKFGKNNEQFDCITKKCRYE